MKITVIDDDIQIHSQLKQLISDFFSDTQMPKITCFRDGEDVTDICSVGADILFLDIEMERSNGIDTAKALREKIPDVIIIFVSSHREYVFDAFRCEALHFIVKPIDKEEFDEVFTRAVHKYNNAHCQLPLKWQNERANVSIQDILYVEAYRRHLIIHTADERFDVVGKMNDIFAFLEPHGFMRIHQGYAVNMSCVRRFGTDSITLKNGESVQMSVRKRAEALLCFDNYLRKWKW